RVANGISALDGEVELVALAAELRAAEVRLDAHRVRGEPGGGGRARREDHAFAQVAGAAADLGFVAGARRSVAVVAPPHRLARVVGEVDRVRGAAGVGRFTPLGHGLSVA